MKIDLHNLTPKSSSELAKAPGFSKMGQGAESAATGSDVASEFQNILSGHLKSLVKVSQHSNKMDRDFAAGKVNNVHDVMVAAARSSLAMDTAIQIRNLAVRAYQKLTQLR